MRYRTMTTHTLDRDPCHIDGRHHGAGLDLHLAGRRSRPVVKGKHAVAGETPEQSLLDHPLRSAHILLRRLKDEMNDAVEIVRLGKIARRREKRRRMAVM